VALRLARFNVVHVPGPFQGLPSPAGGLFVSSFALAGIPLETEPALMAAVLILTGFLMVSSVPYANLKKLTRASANRKKCFWVLGAVSLSFVLLHGAAPLAFFSIYVVSGLLRFDWGQWLLRSEDEVEEQTN
jgi:CDP-diacylglycerol--serine O-phosphatidyltransferase